MRSDELRVAKTESRFRQVNERIANSADQVGLPQLDLVCECADSECGHRIETSLDDYEQIRSDGALFVVAPEHDVPEHEEVVESRPGYRIVEKLKAAGAAARRLNPRRVR